MSTVANDRETQGTATGLLDQEPCPAERFTDELSQLRLMAEQQWEQALVGGGGYGSEDDVICKAELVERIDVCEGRFLAFWHDVVEVIFDQKIERIVALETAFSELRNAMAAVEKSIPAAVESKDERRVYLSHLQSLRETLAGCRDHLSEIIEKKFQVEAEPDNSSSPNGGPSKCRVTRKHRRRK
ncbi:MAG: hypothetical protein HQ592_01820 [Planctomycetes bacterium]|nr:hypothetical protein [Planctomycetota bacterium]